MRYYNTSQKNMNITEQVKEIVNNKLKVDNRIIADIQSLIAFKDLNDEVAKSFTELFEYTKSLTPDDWEKIKQISTEFFTALNALRMIGNRNDYIVSILETINAKLDLLHYDLVEAKDINNEVKQDPVVVDKKIEVSDNFSIGLKKLMENV